MIYFSFRIFISFFYYLVYVTRLIFTASFIYKFAPSQIYVSNY